MRERRDYPLIGPDGRYYSNSRALEEAWKREMRFKSPLTGRTYKESYLMRKAEEEYTRQNYRKNEIDE